MLVPNSSQVQRFLNEESHREDIYNLKTVELERDYRAACQRMLASLDLRTTLNRLSEEIGKLHQALTADGGQILADPATDESIHRYRAMVQKVVAKLDERDQVRQRDGFKEALQVLLQLGEQLGYARRAQPPENTVSPAPVTFVEEVPATMKRPITPVHTNPEVRSSHPVYGDSGFDAVERELAELQSQLVHLQQCGD